MLAASAIAFHSVTKTREDKVCPLCGLNEIAKAFGAEGVHAQRLIFLGELIDRSIYCFDKGSFVVPLSKTSPAAPWSVQAGEVEAVFAARAVFAALRLTAFV